MPNLALPLEDDELPIENDEIEELDRPLLDAVEVVPVRPSFCKKVVCFLPYLIRSYWRAT